MRNIALMFLMFALLNFCVTVTAQTSSGNGNNVPEALSEADNVPVKEVKYPYEELEVPHSDMGDAGDFPIAFLNRPQGTITINTGGQSVVPVVNIYKDGSLVGSSVIGDVTSSGISTDVGQYGSGDYTVTVGDANPLWCTFSL